MLHKLFKTLSPMFRERRSFTDSELSKPELEQVRQVSTHIPQSMQLAANMLTAPAAMMQLTPEEAAVVVGYMRPQFIPMGTTFIHEGEREDVDFMLLVLDGEVTVENIVVSRTTPITVTVLGAGSMHGELGLIDGRPRSASCTASTDVRCAILTRDDAKKLLDEHPRIGAKLMMAIAVRIGERLRDNTEKLKRYAQLTKAMQQEIDRLMP